MSKVVRVGIVGCGIFGQWHLKAFTQLQNEGKTVLVAACDLIEEKRNKAAKEYGVKTQFVCLDSGYMGTAVYGACVQRLDEKGNCWRTLRGTEDKFFIHRRRDEKTGQIIQEQRIYSMRQSADPLLGLKTAEFEKLRAGMSATALAVMRNQKLMASQYNWSKPAIYAILLNLRDGKGAKWMSPASDANTPEELDYRRQLNSHFQRTRHDARGNPITEWHCLGPDHYWDCEAMQVVCAIMAGLFPAQAQGIKSKVEGEQAA